MASFSKGLEGVVAAQTKMSYIDGEKGVLEYVGIPIGDLASKSTFEETVFLLWNGRLPKQAEIENLKAEIRRRYDLPPALASLVTSLPKNAQPMHVMRTLVSALGLFDPRPND